MSSIVVVVGIDDYQSDLTGLTSAVSDAVKFRDTLIHLGLVGTAHEVRLFTAPVVAGAIAPTCKNITNELRELYRHGENVDRMIFFFSGHGLSVYEDGSHTKLKPVIVPVDVESLDDDGRNLIDLDEVRKYFELAGPKEQLFFIDACRDLSYDHYPSVGVLGWGGGPGTAVRPGAARAQATLWAVAPLYTAQGRRGENGVMTAHVIEALTSDRVAVAYMSETADYVVTMESIRGYVKDRVQSAVELESAWKLKYMVPLLDQHGPAVSPLRVLTEVPNVSLTVHVEPDSAAAATDVRLAISGHLLHSYPPRTNHETIDLPPQPYLLTARSTAGAATPARDVVDVRRVNETTVRVTPPGGPPTVTGLAVPPGPSVPSVDVESTVEPKEVPKRTPRATGGIVWADTLEPEVAIELVGLEPPYVRHVSEHSLRAEVPPGAYQISFRLGQHIFNSRTIYVADNESLRVRPTIEVSPLLVELTGTQGPPPSDVVVSESIGPMQAGLLPTILPILGIKPFDETRELFTQFNDVFAGRYRSATEFDTRPLSVVIALDGDGWRRPLGDVLGSIECEIGVDDRVISRRLQPLPTADIRATVARVSERVGTLLVAAPERSFQLAVRIPDLGILHVWCGSLARRATVVTVTLSPDGSLDVTQNILRIPGWEYKDEKVPHVPYGKLLRQLQIGQTLFQSGEMLSALAGHVPESENKQLWRELLYAKWSDPILSCMAYHAWRSGSEPNDRGRHAEADWLLPETARNLARYFGDLPDAQVVYAMQFGEQREQILGRLIEEDAIPVLSVNARLLAEFAERHGRSDAIVARITRLLLPDQVWSAYVSSRGNDLVAAPHVSELSER